MLLHYAAMWGDLETIRRLVGSGRNVDERFSDLNETPLMWAIDFSHAGPETLEVLIELGADVNAVGRNRTIFGKKCTAEKLRVLLAHGAVAHQNPSDSSDLDRLLGDSQTLRMLLETGLHHSLRRKALSSAFWQADKEALAVLEEFGCRVEELEMPPLKTAFLLGTTGEVRERLREVSVQEELDELWTLAIRSGSIKKCEALLSAGASTQYKSEYGETLLMEAVFAQDPEIVRWLLELGVPVDEDNDECETALRQYCGYAGHEVVKVLLDAGANPHHRTEFRNSIIENVTDFKVIELLVKHGVNIDQVSPVGDWPLYTAVQEGDELLVRNLLGLGARVDNTHTGATALTLAVQIDERRIAQILLEAGANPNVEDVDGRCPLHYARTPQMACILLESGADPRASDQYSDTPLETVEEPEVLQLLREAGAGSLPVASEPYSPLSNAVYIGQERRARARLEAGAPVNWVEPSGETALIFAAQKGDGSMISLLLEYGADLDVQDRKGRTALHRAAAPEAEPGYRNPIEFEAFIRGATGSDKRAGDLAQEFRDRFINEIIDATDAMALLLEAGANPLIEDLDGLTPLELACAIGRASRVGCLIPHAPSQLLLRAKLQADRRNVHDPQRQSILELLAKA